MTCKINNNSNFDVTEIEDLIQDLFTFSRKRFGFKNPPVLNLVSDKSNTSPLGKTAHYDPNNMSITIYVDGRHPKDIMRSFSHELVHHRQNENGMFNNLQGDSGDGYAQSNSHLRKMEKEAYLQGNMCFRDWEDGYKSSNPNILNERRIYKMSTKDWKDKELNTLLNEKWGFSMDLSKLNESKKITHMCALEVTHKKSGKKGHPIKHTLTESGDISHYTVEFDDVIVENISVDNLDILVQEEHSHKRDDEKEHDKNKKVVSEEELEDKEKTDSKKEKKSFTGKKNMVKDPKTGKMVPDYAIDGKGAKDLKEEDKEDKKEMGDNPEGVAELMDAINGLSEKESEEVYKMLLKKHGKEDKKHSDMDMKERKLREAIRKIIKTKLKRK